MQCATGKKRIQGDKEVVFLTKWNVDYMESKSIGYMERKMVVGSNGKRERKKRY